MNIIEAIYPYLFNRTIEKYGKVILETSSQYLLASPPETMKACSLEMMKNICSGVRGLAKRVYPSVKADEIYERFYLSLAINCLKTDFLERKLNGVAFLGDIYKNIKSKDFVHITKKELVLLIETGMCTS